MSKNTKTNATDNQKVATSTAYGITADMFTDDKLLADVPSVTQNADGGAEVIEYRMTLKGKGETADYTLTDPAAIKAIKGIQAADALEKYAAYRKGTFLVALVDSPFMKNNEVASVAKLAANYELGVETSTANALENVCRRLGVTFDENNDMHFADDTLPKLSFWHYSQIISLVTDSETGGYKYDSLKDFLRVAQVSPIMSQKKLKELFNDYRNGRLKGATVELPDNVTEKARKDAERVAKAESEKKRAEDAKRIVSASVALEKAEDFTSKQAVALSAVDAVVECVKSIGITPAESVPAISALTVDGNFDGDISDIMSFLFYHLRESICHANPPTATPKSGAENAEN